MYPARFLLAVTWLACLAFACDLARLARPGYRATIRRTTYGIPHILADDMASLGFGEGYVFAQDNLCSLADQVVRARGEISRYFGPGEKGENLNSDITFRALRVLDRAEEDFRALSRETQQWLTGYAAGYNQYLEETGAGAVPGWCRGEPWVRPITAAEILARREMRNLTAWQFTAEIASAAPPGAGAISTGAIPHALDAEASGASNGWAIGSDRSESRRGMLLANPHYPWVGADRFWEKHLTVPGKLDVYGVSTLGSPGVAIGFNRNVAWTHTVSAGKRFTAYLLKLSPGQPTSYLYDGRTRALTSRAVKVEVREANGLLRTVERTIHFSHYGPILNLRGFEWTEERALTYRDANQDNEEFVETWLVMGRATTLEEFQQAHAKPGGLPFINTIAASSDGRAWYADGSAAPGLRPETIAAWRERKTSDPLVQAADARGIILLDGSTSRDEWGDDSRARDPGVVPFALAPQMERRDYVFNANDSYWMPHATERLTGYSPVYGSEATPRSLRTRRNALTLSDHGPGGPSGVDGRFSLEELAQAALGNRGLAAELLLRPLVERCSGKKWVEVDARRVDLGDACKILSAYDGRLDLDRVGASIWREFITQFEEKDLLRAGPLFAVDFDLQDPVNTPRGLAPGGQVLEKLGRAVLVLQRAGIALNAPLGDLQWNNKYGNLTPIHGGLGQYEGVLNLVRYEPNRTTLEPEPAVPPRILGSRHLTSEGYPINYGTSFIMALEYTDSGPRALALLTYSQSGDPGSPRSFDQTALFSAKKWRPILFTEEQIRADPELSLKTIEGRR